jgi:flagellum-specific peptidoglycan hydrolase FlgJ
MNIVTALRSHLSTWLDEPDPTTTKAKLNPNEPDYDANPAVDRDLAEVVANMVPRSDASAEPESAKPVVVAAPYTTNPKEAPLTRTDPATRALITALERAWPELTEVGARTLVAQHRLETGGGSACWNWNLGNMKAGASQPHVYLHGTWEVVSERAANDLATKGNGLARIADDDEVREKGWSCLLGSKVVVFEPPHDVARFAAYRSLSEGVAAWVSYYQAHVMARAPGVLAALNSGDTTAVAHDLKHAGYYTGGEDDYAAGLQTRKAAIDAALGWTP